jgi:hypothetical protein
MSTFILCVTFNGHTPAENFHPLNCPVIYDLQITFHTQYMGAGIAQSV